MATVATAVVLAAVGIDQLALDREPGFQARSTGAGSGIGIRAACVSVEDGQPSLRAMFPAPTGELDRSCRLEDVLSFSYTNGLPERRAFSHLFLVGQGEGGELLWYYPQPPQQGSVPIETGPGVVDHPLPGGIKLSVNHEPGRVRVYGLFSQRPLRMAEVAGALHGGNFLGIEDTEAVTFPVRIAP